MIYVQTKNVVEGFHKWEGAPEPVRFLADRHRHMFEIYAFFRVTDTDREIELILQQREIERYLEETYGKPCEFGNMSCEMIAIDILEHFGCDQVKVLEDGAGGALVNT